jgi:hypothetical protein
MNQQADLVRADIVTAVHTPPLRSGEVVRSPKVARGSLGVQAPHTPQPERKSVILRYALTAKSMLFDSFSWLRELIWFPPSLSTLTPTKMPEKLL